jgi:putative transposase
MAKQTKAKKAKVLGTIWFICDELWDRIRPILEEFWPKKKTGHPLRNWRMAINGIIFRMRSGCQWDHLPKRYGSKSTVHRWFQRWNKGNVMAKIWAALVSECEELGGVSWEWQSADGALAKARFGGIKSAPTPPIAGKTAPNAALSWRKTADRWAS